MRTRIVLLLAVLTFDTACATLAGAPKNAITSDARDEALARAQVWRPVRTSAMNIARGPQGRGAFTPNQVVTCTYDPKELGGKTPKFGCTLPNGDELKIKYGRENGEVYAEVAATRLLWALGFGADAMYPVRVRCKGCPDEDGKLPSDPNHVRTFDIAAVERKMPGRDLVGPGGEGWTWSELDEIDENRGGAPRAHRDALKLLAVLMQHTDSKKDQQRLICLDDAGGKRSKSEACRQPFMLINDLGKTFGRANAFNRDGPGSVNFEAWRDVEIWDQETGCRAKMERSMTGTLENPVISNEGRQFLASRLRLLTDRQLVDLFTVAKFPTRARAKADSGDPVPEAAQWVAAFKDKIRQIADRACVVGTREE